MKIAIATLFRNTNYGAVLQAYASLNVMRDIFNKECYLLDYRTNRIHNMFRISIFDIDVNGRRRITKNSVKRSIKQCINPFGTIVRFQRFNKFRMDYMNTSKKVYCNSNDINLEDTDIIYLGSDQIWNPDITEGFDNVYFGKLGVNKIFSFSYAASLGRTNFSKEEKTELKRMLKNVNKISVREEEGAEIIRELTHKPIVCVPDPTVLVDRTHWEKLAKPIKLNHRKYILVYMLIFSQDVVDLAQKVSKLFNCEIILLDSGSKKRIKGMKKKKHYGPREFLSYIANAEYVITNSFHGTVFSVIFNKQFFTIPHPTKGSRMINFCRKLNLENRLVYGSKATLLDEVHNSIDYNTVMDRLEELKKVGLDFIKETLEETSREQI